MPVPSLFISHEIHFNEHEYLLTCKEVGIEEAEVVPGC